MGKKPQILIIDDDQMDRKALEKIIRVLGYSSYSVSNATSALEQLKSGSFKVILSEWQLIKSKMYDGFTPLHQLIAAIRNGNAGTHNLDVPVIVITSYSFAGTSQVMQSAGLQGIVYKPVNVSNIQATIFPYL